MQTIYLAGGCFWCTEALYLSLVGVENVISGYTGGQTLNPKYEEVCKGTTGHAECIKCNFNEKKIDLYSILDVFFSTHDPTQLNRQGNDVGTQYRSEIFVTNNEQKKVTELFKDKIQKNYSSKVVTKISHIKEFYPAENYHQDYFKNNQGNMYCHVMIKPKLKLLQERYKDLLRK